MEPDKIHKVLNLSIQCARQQDCSISLPIVLISELFECRTIEECETLFELVDKNVSIWKEDFFFKNVKNNLLRTCNDLLRRLSQNQNTVFCGRILIFLAVFFPLFERSGLNLTSEFNQDSSTNYNVDGGDFADEDEDSTKDLEQKIKIDYNFYRKFWQLQEYFRSPNVCYMKPNFKQLQSNCGDVLSVFTAHQIDPSSCFQFQTLGSEQKEDKLFFVKYLTNQHLLELQLSDSNFRRHILIQFLILFQYLTSSVKFKVNATLTEEQTNWIEQTTKQVYQLISVTPPDGEGICKVLQHLLKREEYWNNWKNDGCPDVKVLVEPDAEKTTQTIQATYNSKRTLLGDRAQAAYNANRSVIGNVDLNRLWNLCPDNLEACKLQKRDFLPNVDQYFEEAVKPPLDENTLKYYSTDPNFCWKGLRLLSQKSRYFFVANNQVVKPLSDYMGSVITRLSVDYNKTLNPKPATENEEAKGGDTEDISDDELLKNVECEDNDNDNEPMEVETATTGNGNGSGEPTEANNPTDAIAILPDDILNDSTIEQIGLKLKDYWKEISPFFSFTVKFCKYPKAMITSNPIS